MNSNQDILCDCGASAQLVCMCEGVALCRTCVAKHSLESSLQVHTFLPVESKRLITSGVDCYTAIRRVQTDKSYRDLLSEEIEALNRFKKEKVEAIQSSADQLCFFVNSLIENRQQQLRRDVEIAKTQGRAFADDILRATVSTNDHLSNVFFKNVSDRNIILKSMIAYNSAYEQIDFEETLTSLYNFKVVCPTDFLFEITRTPDEFKDWLGELDRRKKEALRRAERCLKRFLGEYGVWNVSGPPKTDCTSFTANADIWLLGLGMGNANTSGGTTRIQTLEIRKTKSTQGELLYKHPEEPTGTWDGDVEKKFFKVPFKEPVQILKDTDYTIRVQYAAGGQIWSAGGTISNSIDEVTFTFCKSNCEGGDSDNNGNTVTAGPTRDIYFSLDKVQL